MNEKNIVKKMESLITRNTKTRNESTKLITVVRIMLLTIAVYLILSGIICGGMSNRNCIALYLPFFLFFAFIFYTSYYVKTNISLCLLNIGMLTWICTFARKFGWDTGIQHFVIVLLVLCFFSSYKNYRFKVLYAILLCGVRIALFYLCQNDNPDYILSTQWENALQLIHILVVFWSIAVIAFIFSKDGQELERKLVEYNEQLMQQANTDALTGLSNRRKAKEYMEYITKHQLDRNGFSLCICDIDFFKKINDQYGHDFGDEVLVSIAAIFKKEITGKDFVARWGGEEFLFLFPESNGDDAYVKLEKIKTKIKNMVIKKGDTEVRITMTYGLAEHGYQEDMEATLKEADQKLYIGKESGRDVIIY